MIKILFIIFLFLFQSSYARDINSVLHSHNGRVHSHVLPQAGINHRHGLLGQGRLIQKTTKTNKRKSNYINKVSHSHDGRTHTHILPKIGIKHRHGSLGQGKTIQHQKIQGSKKKYRENNYFPKYIYLQRYPTISGNQHSFRIKQVNSGNIFHWHPPIVVADYKITPTNEALKKFRTALDNLKVWNWRNKYIVNRSETWSNRIILKYPDKQIDVQLRNKYPGNYNKFHDALMKLIEYKKYSLSREEFTRKLNSLKKKKH